MRRAEKECQALVGILKNALREMKDPNKALLLNLINISTIWLEYSRKRTCFPALEQITVAIWRECSSFKWPSKSQNKHSCLEMKNKTSVIGTSLMPFSGLAEAPQHRNFFLV